MITERDLGYESDNLLNYYAGPIKIKISGEHGIIIISSNYKWKHLLLECLEVAKEAWMLDNTNNITISELKIEIKYNLKNINKYIEHTIIFL